jgi:hypothetical protein
MKKKKKKMALKHGKESNMMKEAFSRNCNS